MILKELTTLFNGLCIPRSTNKFPNPAPDTFCVFTPISDMDIEYSDDYPEIESCSVRIGIFTRKSWTELVRKIKTTLRDEGFIISNSLFIEHEVDTKFNHYNIDVEKLYLIGGKSCHL